MANPLKKSTRRLIATVIITASLLVLSVVSVLLGRQVIADLEQQRTASSDNVQWTLTQVEVDYLLFINALEHQGHIAGNTSRQGLEDVRRQFDVFYSRIDTLNVSPVFADLRKRPAYVTPLSQINAYLSDAVEMVDADDAGLIAGLEDLLAKAETLRDDVRAISTTGLSYFAELADSRRAITTSTLMRLATLAATLFCAFAGVSIYLLFMNRKVRTRGRALAQANQRINTVLATSLDAVVVVDSKGRVLEFNPAAEAMFARSRADTLGHPIGELIMATHKPHATPGGANQNQSGQYLHYVGQGRVTLDAQRASGDLFPVEVALEAAFIREEEIVIGFIRDISRQIADEQELITARDKALAGEKVKTDVLNVMSHEIRTPLNGLLGNLALLKVSGLTEDQQHLARNMDISGEILSHHVDSVLDIARLEADGSSSTREPVNLSVLAQSLVDAQRVHAASRGNVITWAWIGPPHPKVLSDMQRLRQVLLNLVGNAIKFTENGRITLELERCAPSPCSSVWNYEFRVIDTGIGIKEADQSRVFEDFETSDASLGRSVGGTGLGLGIARRFVHALGGEIGVESIPAEGSLFWVRLPLEEAPPDARPNAVQSSHQRVERLHVLVVEDNDINRDVIRRMLEMDNHRVTTAKDGKTGIDLARSRRFDAILMDISMPVMDGSTAAHHIRTGGGASARAPIIAVSANVLPEAVQGFRAAGMDAFLGKPLSIERLRDALNAQVPSRAMVGSSPFEGSRYLSTEQSKALEDALNRDGAALHAALQDISQVDPQTLAQTCHQLAGTAGMMEMAGLVTVLNHMENALLSEDCEAVSAAALNFSTVWSAR